MRGKQYGRRLGSILRRGLETSRNRDINQGILSCISVGYSLPLPQSLTVFYPHKYPSIGFIYFVGLLTRGHEN